MRWQYKINGNKVNVDIIIQGNLAFSPELSLSEFKRIICSDRPQHISSTTRIIKTGGTDELIQFINNDIVPDPHDHNIIEMLIAKMKEQSDKEILAAKPSS
jgi:hypothetical protein